MTSSSKKKGQTIYVSATPGPFETQRAERTVEQIIRPTGLLDPEVEVRPVAGQIDDLLGEIRRRTESDERVLVTTLTKKMAEDLSEYLQNNGVNCKYMHYDIETIERIELLRGLRAGEFDVLVGINLLREGLDLPEVSLVAILDADKEGFLRSESSLIQTIGRARATRTARSLCTRTRSPARCAAPSTRPSAAAPRRTPITAPTASRPRPSSGNPRPD